MSVRVSCLLVAVASWSASLAGCFGHRWCRTEQAVLLSVTNVPDEGPASGATVVIGQENRFFVDPPGGQSDDTYLDRFEEFSDVTSPDGTAVPRARGDFLCPENLAPGLYEERLNETNVIGESFLIRVTVGTDSEILTVSMLPGASVLGELFTVTILEIADPQVTADEP